ncbi:MAG: hypothetical protein ABSG92_10020 [Conexivisphaerales archaeon]
MIRRPSEPLLSANLCLDSIIGYSLEELRPPEALSSLKIASCLPPKVRHTAM